LFPGRQAAVRKMPGRLFVKAHPLATDDGSIREEIEKLDRIVRTGESDSFLPLFPVDPV